MGTPQLDNIFLGILQNCGQIEPFLDVVFSFLARRTDFFLIMSGKEGRMGFPEGIAQKMVLKVHLCTTLSVSVQIQLVCIA